MKDNKVILFGLVDWGVCSELVLLVQMVGVAKRKSMPKKKHTPAKKKSEKGKGKGETEKSRKRKLLQKYKNDLAKKSNRKSCANHLLNHLQNNEGVCTAVILDDARLLTICEVIAHLSAEELSRVQFTVPCDFSQEKCPKQSGLMKRKASSLRKANPALNLTLLVNTDYTDAMKRVIEQKERVILIYADFCASYKTEESKSVSSVDLHHKYGAIQEGDKALVIYSYSFRGGKTTDGFAHPAAFDLKDRIRAYEDAGYCSVDWRDSEPVRSYDQMMSPKYYITGGSRVDSYSSMVGDQENDDIICMICGSPHDGERMLLCDSNNCGRACHTYCLKPKLLAVPDGDWYCSMHSGDATTDVDFEGAYAEVTNHEETWFEQEFQVIVPKGVKPGQIMHVKVPHPTSSGEQVIVQCNVPDDVSTGDIFHLQLSPALQEKIQAEKKPDCITTPHIVVQYHTKSRGTKRKKGVQSSSSPCEMNILHQVVGNGAKVQKRLPQKGIKSF